MVRLQRTLLDWLKRRLETGRLNQNRLKGLHFILLVIDGESRRDFKGKKNILINCTLEEKKKSLWKCGIWPGDETGGQYSNQHKRKQARRQSRSVTGWTQETSEVVAVCFTAN